MVFYNIMEEKMSNEEFYGMSKDELFDFIDKCAVEDNYNLLRIKTTEDANTFIKICKKFSGASILGFSYNSDTTSPRRLFKRNNDIILTLGAEVFLPDLRYGETYNYSIEMVFNEVQEFSFVPNSIDKSTEIDVETFIVDKDNCIFSCFSRDDKTKKIYIKCKNVFVENFIDPEEDEEEKTPPINVIDRAEFMYNQKNYKECIRILKYEYFDLEKDAEANNLMALCFSAQNNLYEALRYINNTIELNPNRSTYYYNKAFYLCRSDLQFDGLKCFNTGLAFAKNEEEKRRFSKNIIDLVNAKTRIYTEYNIRDIKSFNEYIYYFESIIDLEYCFPEFKEKFIEYKKAAVNFFFNKQKYDIDNWFGMNRNYFNLAENLKAILNVKDLDNAIKEEIQHYLDTCNSNIEDELNRKKENEELEKYVLDLSSKEYSKDEIIEAARNKFPSVYKYKVEDIIDKISKNNLKSTTTSPMAPLPPSWKKKDAIRDFINTGMTKAEMIEQLSADFGISEESAAASINAYYQDDGLGLKEYFDEFDDDEDEDDLFYDDLDDDI